MSGFSTLSRPLKAFVALAAALGVFGAVSSAQARPEFPGVIQEHYPDLACAPQCSLCHLSPLGGGPFHNEDVDMYVGPHRGFGSFYMNLTAMPGGTISKSNLPSKLDAIANPKNPCNSDSAFGDITDTGICDSDGDGTPDWIEVSTGDDPNVPGPGNGAICPKYGCGASSIGALPRRPSDAGHAVAAMAGLGVALVLGRRLRRRA